MSANNLSRKETERTKLIQEKCQTLLTQMLRDEDNKYCVDCDAKGPRWASWNLGVFLCIRCAGMHRNLGVHISRVKSVNLDTWTPEQVISLQQMGNSRARAVYEAQLPDGFRRPQTNNALESFIRAKYEHKKYLAREWVPPSPPKVDWAKEIDEELERQKRKKKAAQANSVLGLGVVGSGTLSGGGANDKKSTAPAKSAPLPAPLPKPKAGQSGSSPKTQRLSISSNSEQQTNDLLGLSTPTKPTAQSSGGASGGNGTQDLHNDSFSGFLSAPAVASSTDAVGVSSNNTAAQNSATQDLNGASAAANNNCLAKEEQDFFNQGTLVGSEKDKSGKLTKDSILSLYAAAPTHNPHQQPMQFGMQQAAAHQQQMYTQNAFGNMSFTGMSPGFMGGAAAGAQAQQAQQQHQQHQQFMTPPNSASMYNAPVMTAPNAFSAPGIGGGGLQQLGSAGGFGAQFPVMQHAGYNAQMSAANMMTQNMLMGGAAAGGGIMATGQTAIGTSNGVQLMQVNQSRLMGGGFGTQGMGMAGGMMQQQPQSLPQMSGGGGGLQSSLGSLGGSMPMMGMGGMPAAFPTTASSATSAAASTANLNQQFGNLNIGNVWQ